MTTLPSILLLLPDDYPRNMLPAYGAKHSLTPSIDQLAQRGAVFENAYTTSPLCTPSRYSILTGTYASSAPLNSRSRGGGVRPIKFNVWLQGQANATIAGQLRRKGFTTGFLGKWHVASSEASEASGEPSQREQQEMVRREGGFDYADDVYFANPSLDRYAHNPEWMAFLAVRFMRNAMKLRDSPFFLYFAPTLPHEPLNNIVEQLQRTPRAGPPEEAHTLHSLRQTEEEDFIRDAQALRVDVTAALVRSSILCASGGDSANVSLCPSKRLPKLSTLLGGAPWLPTDLSVREVALVMSGAAWLDASLKSVFWEAQASTAASAGAGGLLIIFTSDHGPGWAGKGHPYEAGIRVPLIVQPPPHWPINMPQRLNDQTTHLELFPTLQNIANIPTHDLLLQKSSGHRLAEALLGNTSPLCSRGPNNITFFVEIGISRTIVSLQWKLIVVSRPELEKHATNCISFQGSPMDGYLEALQHGDAKPKLSLIYDGYRHHSGTYCDTVQLYDRSTDPGENINIASARTDVVETLGARLREFVRHSEPMSRFTV